VKGPRREKFGFYKLPYPHSSDPPEELRKSYQKTRPDLCQTRMTRESPHTQKMRDIVSSTRKATKQQASSTPSLTTLITRHTKIPGVSDLASQVGQRAYAGHRCGRSVSQEPNLCGCDIVHSWRSPMALSSPPKPFSFSLKCIHMYISPSHAQPESSMLKRICRIREQEQEQDQEQMMYRPVC
jgi:hypothetical protein